MPSFKNHPIDLVLDVRSKLEFFLGHLDGAENVPVDRLPDALEGRDGVTRDSPILVYCASGMRSAQAKALLDRAGYKRVVDGGAIGSAREAYRAA